MATVVLVQRACVIMIVVVIVIVVVTVFQFVIVIVTVYVCLVTTAGGPRHTVWAGRQWLVG